jgi:hypothetical protein
MRRAGARQARRERRRDTAVATGDFLPWLRALARRPCRPPQRARVENRLSIARLSAAFGNRDWLHSTSLRMCRWRAARWREKGIDLYCATASFAKDCLPGVTPRDLTRWCIAYSRSPGELRWFLAWIPDKAVRAIVWRRLALFEI